MLQNTYQTKVPLRCWYLQHRIPLSSFLALLLAIVMSATINMLVRNVCYAAEPTASLELSTNELVGRGANEAAVMANTKVTVNVSSADTYTLTLKMDKLELTNGSTTLIPGNVVGDNTWGYKWEDESTYNAPRASGNNLTVPSLANYAASFSKNLVFAAKFSENAEAGHYKTSGVLSLVATPATTTYTITYDANGGNNIPSSQICTVQDVAGANCTTTLSNSKPTRTGYTFLGWADNSSATSKQYDAGGSITVNGSKTIYAVWRSNGQPWSNGTYSGVDYMQDITPGTNESSFCKSSLPTHASIILKDKRDQRSYTIVKMEDGKCWMTQNLQLMGSRQLTPTDSNVSSEYTLPAPSTSGFNNDAASNTYLSGDTGYYTWCAATAGTCSSATSQGDNAPSSICPKGWQLPTGMVVSGKNSNNDFYNLFKGMNLSISGSLSATGNTGWNDVDRGIAQGAPYNFAYTGTMPGGLSYSRGYWWSRTAGDSINAYSFGLNSSLVALGTDSSRRYYGFAVRCVARTSGYDSAPE